MRLAPKNSSLIKVGSILILLSVTALAQEGKSDTAAQKKDALQAGTVDSVVEHAEGRVFDIVSKVIPVYDNYPFYDITIRTPERSYVVRYESMGGYYPSGWQIGKQIKFRREKGQLLLLRYDGEFVPARILN
jgi:hypothetical protein